MAEQISALTLKIKANGKEFLNPGMISFSLTHQANTISFCELSLYDGDVSKQDFKISSEGDFAPGNEVEIEIGHSVETKPIFKGIIVRQLLKSRKYGGSSITLEIKHEAVKMSHIRNARHFLEQHDGAIMEQLIKDHGLQAAVEGEFEPEHERMVQYKLSDWDFLVMRAEANGRLVYTEVDKIVVAAPKVLSEKDAIKATYGVDIYEFEAEAESRDQRKSLASIAWDHTSQELHEQVAKAPEKGIEAGSPAAEKLAEGLDEEEEKLRHPGDLPDAELKAWSEATLLRSRLSKVRGRVQLQGSDDLKPGGTLNLQGISTGFNGPAFISAVRHSIQDGHWLTDVELGLSAECFVNQQTGVVEAPVSGLLGPMPGLQIGVVKEIKDDPAGFFRVLVKMAVIDDTEEGIWCRVAHPDAGANHGLFFQPAIGDEVVLGFLNDDPRHAIVLGSLHNKDANKPPITDNDDYFKKGVVTAEGLMLTFDDENKIIIVETPGGKKITLDEDEGVLRLEDENRNKIELSSDGIVIESGKDLILKATGDISVEGLNIEQSAQAQFKAEGSAGIEVSSSAIAVLKGSLVQIN